MTTLHRRTVLRGIGAGTALVVAGGTAIAEDTDESDDEGLAGVRVGHLSPDTPAVDVYVGRGDYDVSETEPAVSGLSYRGFAPGAGGNYLSLRPGEYTVKVTPAGGTTVAVEARPEFKPQTGYSILAVGEFEPEDTTFSGASEPALGPLALVDYDGRGEESEEDEDDAPRARFVHASPDAEAVDIYVNGTLLAGGVEFGDSTGYVTAPTGDVTVAVKKGSTTALSVTVSLSEGDKVSAYVVGNAIPDDGDLDSDNGFVGNLGAVLTADGSAEDDAENGEGDDEEGEEAEDGDD